MEESRADVSDARGASCGMSETPKRSLFHFIDIQSGYPVQLPGDRNRTQDHGQQVEKLD